MQVHYVFTNCFEERGLNYVFTFIVFELQNFIHFIVNHFTEVCSPRRFDIKYRVGLRLQNFHYCNQVSLSTLQNIRLFFRRRCATRIRTRCHQRPEIVRAAKLMCLTLIDQTMVSIGRLIIRVIERNLYKQGFFVKRFINTCISYFCKVLKINNVIALVRPGGVFIDRFTCQGQIFKTLLRRGLLIKSLVVQHNNRLPRSVSNYYLRRIAII